MGVLGQCRLGEGVGDVGRGRVDVAVIDRVRIAVEVTVPVLMSKPPGRILPPSRGTSAPHAALGQRHADGVEVVRSLAMGRVGAYFSAVSFDIRIADAVHHGQRLFQAPCRQDRRDPS